MKNKAIKSAIAVVMAVAAVMSLNIGDAENEDVRDKGADDADV